MGMAVTAGATFVASTLERVIEEQARGDQAKAEAVRRSLVALIGDDLARGAFRADEQDALAFVGSLADEAQRFLEHLQRLL